MAVRSKEAAMRLFRLAAVPVAAVLLASAGPAPQTEAQSPSQAERQCFFPQQVRNFRSGRNQSIYLKVRQDKVFELRTLGACTEVGDAYSLAFIPERGSSQLCTGDWATLAAPEGVVGPIQSCRVEVVRALSAEEVEALPPGQRP